MRDRVIVDTNVAVVANGNTPQASPKCVCACIDRLIRIKDAGLVLIDDANLVLDEYRHNLSPSGQPGTGDMFFKWLWNNQGYEQQCQTVKITPNTKRGFNEFPADPDLAAFDADDRKFVAVAVASGVQPPILNASDRDWWEYRSTLNRHDVLIEFLCTDLMRER